MGASNFHFVNASRVFAITGIEEDFEWDDVKENINYKLEHCGYNHISTSNDPHELRSYPSANLTTIQKSFIFNGLSVTVEINTVMRSGYYEGACLDWHPEYEVEGYELDDYDDIALAFEYHNFSEKRATYLAPMLKKRLLAIREELIAVVERIFAENSDQYNVVATFSNGETIYARAE